MIEFRASALAKWIVPLPRFLALLIALFFTTAQDLPDKFQERRVYRIPRLELRQALSRLATLSEVQIVYDDDLLHGLDAPALEGEYRVLDALHLLLSQSGLEPALIARDTISLQKAPLASTSERYLEALPLSILANLCHKFPLTEKRFRVVLRISIGNGGHVTSLKLLGTSGDAVRDALIAGAYADATLPVPPRDLPQPITLVIDPDASEFDDVCARNPLPMLK